MFKINDNYLKLPGSYLFSTIAKKVAAYTEANPDAKIIRLGIGDVTQPIAPAIIEKLHGAVDEMGHAETFHGYAPDLGYAFLRDTIAKNVYFPPAVIRELIFLVVFQMDAVPGYDVRESYLVLFQFGLHLAPAGRLYRFQETGQQFFLCGLTATFSAEVFDAHVHVSLVDRTETHAHGLLVDYRNGYIYIVGPVEIGNDATREIRVGIAVVVRKLVDEVKRFEFVVGIVILPAVVEIEIPYGDLTVILILEALDFPIPFRFFLEDVIPSVDTVKCPVELVLL